MLLFKEASNKVGRVDKDLQELIDSQVYIVEELCHSRLDDKAIKAVMTDFSFILEKTLKALFVSTDSSCSSYSYTPKVIQTTEIS